MFNMKNNNVKDGFNGYPPLRMDVISQLLCHVKYV